MPFDMVEILWHHTYNSRIPYHDVRFGKWCFLGAIVFGLSYVCGIKYTVSQFQPLKHAACVSVMNMVNSTTEIVHKADLYPENLEGYWLFK